jgi:hypothetical protein
LQLRLCSIVFLTAVLRGQDSANITKPSQSDMLLGTRVPRDLVWKAPTAEERWRVLMRSLVLSPGAYLRAAGNASTGQRSNTPEDYGQGWDAFGKRYGNSFLTFSLQDAASQGLAAAAGYEVRYIQCKCTGVFRRIGHALAFSVVTYDRNGKTVFNWPSFVGSYSAGMLSTAYTPNQKWSAQGIQAGTNGLMFGAISSVVQEFMPASLIPRKKKRNPPPPPTPQTP